MLTLDSCPVPTASVQGRRLENEAVLVYPDKGDVIVINDVGAEVWSLADGRRSIRDIVAAVRARYAMTPAEAEADALAFIADLQAKGVMTIR
jgi:hypothetical protein